MLISKPGILPARHHHRDRIDEVKNRGLRIGQVLSVLHTEVDSIRATWPLHFDLPTAKSRSRGSAVHVYICQGSLMSTTTRPLLHSSVDNRFMYTCLSIFAKLCRDHRGSWRASDIDLVFWLIHIFRNGPPPIRLSLDEMEGFTPMHHRPFHQYRMSTA